MKKSGKKISFFKKLPNNHGTPHLEGGQKNRSLLHFPNTWLNIALFLFWFFITLSGK